LKSRLKKNNPPLKLVEAPGVTVFRANAMGQSLKVAQCISKTIPELRLPEGPHPPVRLANCSVLNPFRTAPAVTPERLPCVSGSPSWAVVKLTYELEENPREPVDSCPLIAPAQPIEHFWSIGVKLPPRRN